MIEEDKKIMKEEELIMIIEILDGGVSITAEIEISEEKDKKKILKIRYHQKFIINFYKMLMICLNLRLKKIQMIFLKMICNNKRIKDKIKTTDKKN